MTIVTVGHKMVNFLGLSFFYSKNILLCSTINVRSKFEQTTMGDVIERNNHKHRRVIMEREWNFNHLNSDQKMKIIIKISLFDNEMLLETSIHVEIMWNFVFIITLVGTSKILKMVDFWHFRNLDIAPPDNSSCKQRNLKIQ